MISLGLTVWVIYTADHLIDAKRLIHPAATERHRFHQKYFRVLLVLAVIATMVDAIQLFFIRKVVFIDGLVLTIVILVYFLIQRSLKLFKELTGAVLYVGGVLLIPWSVKDIHATGYEIMLIIQFALTALINLVLFSWFDKQQDEQDRQSSFATVMGENPTKNSLVSLFVIQACIAVTLIFIGDARPVVVLIMMNTLLLTIFLNKKYFETNDRYRLLGDAIFLLPIVYIL
jgi:hypothetical protein